MKLSKAQLRWLAWLNAQGGSGVVDRFGRVLAGGENSFYGSATPWLHLIAHGLVSGADGRLQITEYGKRHLLGGGK